MHDDSIGFLLGLSGDGDALGDILDPTLGQFDGDPDGLISGFIVRLKVAQALDLMDGVSLCLWRDKRKYAWASARVD